MAPHRPLTLPAVIDRYPELIAGEGKAIHTFSNGTAWDCWAEGNCYSCRFWDMDGTAGELCAFEGAALIGCVSPELARMFGWVQVATQYGPRSGWQPPEQCRFFADRSDDSDDPPPPPDPNQLVLLSDPTEDLALFGAPSDVDVGELAGVP